MNSQRIDLHHHVFAPELVSALGQRRIDWNGGAGMPPWSLSLACDAMERHGIAAAVASVQPHACWPELGQAIRWASYSNEFLARIVRDDPQHFGGVASLPLPDVAASLRELEYAYDELGLDGVSMLTSVDGRYLGDPIYEELFQELERRRAVVVIHPNTAPSNTDNRKLPLPDSLVEFVFDTTRTVASLMFSGRLQRFPSIRYIVPHAGGTIPYLAGRMALGVEMVPRYKELVPLGPIHYLKRLYYDTAVATSAPQLAALSTFVPPSQIVYGSDFPYIADPVTRGAIASLDAHFDAAGREAIYRNNALTLFPRLAVAPPGGSLTVVTTRPTGAPLS